MAVPVVRIDVSRMCDQESGWWALIPEANAPCPSYRRRVTLTPTRPAEPPWSASARQQRRRLQRFRPPTSGEGHLRRPRRAAVPGGDDPLQQRLSPGPAPGQLPPARRLHRAAAGAADAGAPDGAAADDRRGPRCQRVVHHGGDPLLLLRAVRQEGRLPHLHRRPSGRRPARHRGRAPGDDDDAPRARRCTGSSRCPVDQLTALGILADHFLAQDLSDAIVVSPDFGNAKTATQFSRLLGLSTWRPAASAASPTTASSSTRSSATSRASGRSCSTTRSPPAARSSSCSTGWPTPAAPAQRSRAPTASSSARPSSGCGSTR